MVGLHYLQPSKPALWLFLSRPSGSEAFTVLLVQTFLCSQKHAVLSKRQLKLQVRTENPQASCRRQQRLCWSLNTFLENFSRNGCRAASALCTSIYTAVAKAASHSESETRTGCWLEPAAHKRRKQQTVLFVVPASPDQQPSCQDQARTPLIPRLTLNTSSVQTTAAMLLPGRFLPPARSRMRHRHFHTLVLGRSLSALRPVYRLFI